MMDAVRSTRVGVVVLLSASCAACAARAERGVSAAPVSISADSLARLEAIYGARQAEARTRFTDADVRFMTRMIGHHAQALRMAELVPARSQDAEIRTLAARIMNAQSDEIGTMQQWLRNRAQPVPEAGGDHPHNDGAMMPGMVTPEQMRQLEASRGADFDQLFLELMIQHHQGAVTMVEELFSTDGAAQDEEAFKFATDAQVDQKTEVERMEMMLRARRGVAQ